MEEQNRLYDEVKEGTEDSSSHSPVKLDESESESRLEREKKLKRLKERISSREKRREEPNNGHEEPLEEKSQAEQSEAQEVKEAAEVIPAPEVNEAAQVKSAPEVKQEEPSGVKEDKIVITSRNTTLEFPVPKDMTKEDKEKIEIGVQELITVIKEVPVLDFLRGRIAKTIEKGLDFPTLLGFYRISARMLKEEFDKKREHLKRTEIELDDYKRIAEDLKTGFIRPSHQARISPRDLLKEEQKAKIAEEIKTEEGQQELSMLKEVLKQKEKKICECIDLLDKQKADFVNYRNRSAKEIAIQVDASFGDLMSRFLPIFDNFDRALDAARNTQDIASVVQGIEMIRYQIEEVLKKSGVEQIDACGQPFNPKLHECIQLLETDDYPDDTVVEEVNRGYTSKSKLLRPALVKVSKRKTPMPPAPKPPAEEPQAVQPVEQAQDEPKIEASVTAAAEGPPAETAPAAVAAAPVDAPEEATAPVEIEEELPQEMLIEESSLTGEDNL